MVLEYFRQVERVKKIYENIDDYYRNNASSLGEEPVKNRWDNKKMVLVWLILFLCCLHHMHCIWIYILIIYIIR